MPTVHEKHISNLEISSHIQAGIKQDINVDAELENDSLVKLIKLQVLCMPCTMVTLTQHFLEISVQ